MLPDCCERGLDSNAALVEKTDVALPGYLPKLLPDDSETGEDLTSDLIRAVLISNRAFFRQFYAQLDAAENLTVNGNILGLARVPVAPSQ